MEWFKKHSDTIVILSGIISSLLWMNMKFNEVHDQINDIKTEIAVMKTVLIMQKIMPVELALKEGK